MNNKMIACGLWLGTLLRDTIHMIHMIYLYQHKVLTTICSKGLWGVSNEGAGFKANHTLQWLLPLTKSVRLLSNFLTTVSRVQVLDISVSIITIHTNLHTLCKHHLSHSSKYQWSITKITVLCPPILGLSPCASPANYNPRHINTLTILVNRV